MQVLKRDGKIEKWDDTKLLAAITKAASECSETIENITDIVSKVYNKAGSKQKDVVSVSEIHKIVEDILMASRYKNTARAYIQRQHKRDAWRESETKLYKDIMSFLDQSSEEFIRENANKSATTINTHRDLIAGIVSKNLALTQILPEEVAQAHSSGAIHVHDTDYLLSPLTNCCLVNYPAMLENGFKIGDASICPPKSISTAATVMTQIAQACASAMYGGQSHSHIDKYLSPYVQKSWEKIKLEQGKWCLPDEWADQKIEKEVYDAMQCFLYQINSLTTTNGQTPFLTISLGLDTSRWGRLITKQYLTVHEEGIGKDKITPVFPKIVFFLDDAINLHPGTPNYDLKQQAVRCSTKRMYPDYVYVKRNQEVTGCKEEPVTPMGCRSFLSQNITEGKESLMGRFNIGVVSINLPYIALESKERGCDFFSVLEEYCNLCLSAHMSRVDRLKGTKAKQNPILWMQGVLATLPEDDVIDPLLFDGSSSISLGYIGLSETSEILKGVQDKEFCLGVLKYLDEKCQQWKQETGLGFSVYGTPSESFCYKAANAVRNRFGTVPEIKEYITNSFHMPVHMPAHISEKWGYEQGFDVVSSGGNITYVEVPNLQSNLEAYEGLLNYACHLNLHYFAINSPVDRCFGCGYEGEFISSQEGFACPSCGNTDPSSVSVVRRVSGYISSPNSRPYNRGKQAEVIQRVKHNM